MRIFRLNVVPLLWLFPALCWALPEEYASVVERLLEHSPQPRYSVRHLEFLHAMSEQGGRVTGPARLTGPETNSPSGRIVVIGGRSLRLPEGLEMPLPPSLPETVDADFREQTASQFDLAREMAEHAFIEVHRKELIEGISPLGREAALEKIYLRWTDPKYRDQEFRSGNIQHLLDYWVAVYKFDYLAGLRERVREQADRLDEAPLRGKWLALFLVEAERDHLPSPVLEGARRREILAAREDANQEFAHAYLDRFLEGALPEDSPAILELLHMRLRDEVCQPKLLSWLVEKAPDAKTLLRVLNIELWDVAFLRFSVAAPGESPEAVVDRLHDPDTDPFQHPQRGFEGQTTFIAALSAILGHSLGRLNLEAEAFFERFVDELLGSNGFVNFKVAALIQELLEFAETHPAHPVLPSLERGLRGLIRGLSLHQSEQPWRQSASSEATMLLFHFIVQRKSWSDGTERSAASMLQAIDSPDTEPFERAAARYALNQFGPEVFTDLLDRRFADPRVGGQPFERCVRALFEALEISPPPEL